MQLRAGMGSREVESSDARAVMASASSGRAVEEPILTPERVAEALESARGFASIRSCESSGSCAVTCSVGQRTCWENV